MIKELEKKYAPLIETYDSEIQVTKLYLADLIKKRSELIKEYIECSLSHSC